MLTLLILLHIYFVSFLDKPEKTAPQLSPRAMEQRAKWGIATDGMDYPVSPMYMNQIQKAGAKILHKSRWFNGVTCEMDSATAAKVEDLNCVTNVEMTRQDKTKSDGLSKMKRMREYESETMSEDENTTAAQLALYNLQTLHEAGYKGQGILMTVCDGGFYNANTLKCFRPDTMELGHFDFTDDGTDFYGTTGTHGTECLSTIAGRAQNYLGAATEAQYYLMRAEEAQTESPKEMDNLVAALEKADSLGVNIFSVSLGYYIFDNSQWNLNKDTDLDGKTTRCSRAATIAARKGMLVCVAAGNEGDKTWGKIAVPGDADSVLTVGAVGIDSIAGGFSSYGPSSDGRIKPEVCAVGVQATLIRPDGYIVRGNGTSFATPLIAGFAACLWSALPNENAMQIRERILRSSDRYTNPDTANYVYGYGIPDAWKALTMKPTGMEEPTSYSSLKGRGTKWLRNGQLYILYNGKIYDIRGQRIE